MNVRGIESVTSTPVQAAAAAATTVKPKEAPRPPVHAAPPPPPPAATPAATVSMSGVPATVKAEDRSLYMQILKSVGGNVNAALAQLAAAEAKEATTGAD
jgi:hypothetical protein